MDRWERTTQFIKENCYISDMDSRFLRSRAAAPLRRAMLPVWSHIRRPTLLLAGLGTLCAPLGCTLVRPEARATAMEVRRSSDSAAEVVLLVELRNPGKDEIELVQYDYTVSVADGSSYGGRWAALQALPPGQTVTAEIPALLPTSGLDRDASAWRASGTLSYRDPRSFARILYEAGILKSEISFSGSGVMTPAPKPADGNSPAPSAAPAP